MDDTETLVMVSLADLAAERDPRVRLDRLVDLCARATGADRCTVYAVDRERGELRALVAQRVGVEVLRLPIGAGLAGHVAETGETVNVPDAYADPRFHADVDRLTGFRTTNILTVPIWSQDGTSVVGVIQVLNKHEGSFERHDQMLLERIAGAVMPSFEQLAHGKGQERA